MLTIIILALLLLGAAALYLRRRDPVRRYLRAGGQFLANAALIVNIHPKGRTTRLADAAFTLRYLICKSGTDASHVDICTASDKPLGVVPDMTPTSDASGVLTYPLPVNFLGLNEDTERMIASAAISLDDMVVPAAAGKIKTLPTSGGGTTYIIGKAVTAAVADLDQVEVIPCFPYLVTIAT